MQIDELIEQLGERSRAASIEPRYFDAEMFLEASKALRDLKASADALAEAMIDIKAFNNSAKCQDCGSTRRIATQALAAYREKFTSDD